MMGRDKRRRKPTPKYVAWRSMKMLTLARDSLIRDEQRRKVRLSGVAFLPRDVLFKRGLCRHAVTLRCLSVTFVHSVKSSTHILRLFSPSSRSIILVFSYETGREYTNWNPPPNGSIEYEGVYKITTFRLEHLKTFLFHVAFNYY